MTLLQLAEKYGTDKTQHGYIEPYAENLPKQCRYLLEIGAAKGASALMWRDYYPDCDIHLLDLFVDKNHVSTKWCRQNFFVPHRGDQSDMNVLTAIHEQFEVIIDDGSHNADHQLVSFKHLFLNNLQPGGIYAIEDLHCNTDSFYWNRCELIQSVDDTALGMAKHFIATGKIRCPFFNEGESEVFANIIEKMELLADEKLLLIWKK